MSEHQLTAGKLFAHPPSLLISIRKKLEKSFIQLIHRHIDKMLRWLQSSIISLHIVQPYMKIDFKSIQIRKDGCTVDPLSYQVMKPSQELLSCVHSPLKTGNEHIVAEVCRIAFITLFVNYFNLKLQAILFQPHFQAYWSNV